MARADKCLKSKKVHYSLIGQTKYLDAIVYKLQHHLCFIQLLFFSFFCFFFIQKLFIMSGVSKLAQFGKKHIAHGIGRSTELVIEKAKGTYVYTAEGKKYLDLTTGIGVTNTGKALVCFR